MPPLQMKNLKQRDKALSLEDFYNGTLLSIETAESLYDEAILLSSNNKHAGSFTKCVLSLEEIGKSILLVLAATLLIQFKEMDKRYWKKFWTIFYDHLKKLNFAIQYYLFTSEININTKDHVRQIFEFIQKTSKELDKDKQKGQYTDFSEDKFVKPIDIDFKENSESLLEVLDRLLELQRERFPNELNFDNYIEIITNTLKYTRSLKMLEKETLENLDDAILQLYQDTSFYKYPPTEEFILKDIKGKYEILPNSIKITLQYLNKSKEFFEFYNYLKVNFGYPDWVILTVLYNISFNVKAFPSGILPEKNLELIVEKHKRHPLEKETDSPIPIEKFINHDYFELALDKWLEAYLIKMGVILPKSTNINSSDIRRIAEGTFGFFKIDVEHKNIFHFKGINDK
ncbi:MAG: AbiV family abortive infection protein [Nitrosopumilus sp.]